MLKIKTDKGFTELTANCEDNITYCADCICAIRAMISAPSPRAKHLLATALYGLVTTGELGEHLPQDILEERG